MYCRTVLLFLVTLFSFGHGDYFTGIDGMKGLIDVEAVLINKLEMYIPAQKIKLVKMAKILTDYKRENAIATTNPYEYVTNPIRAFLLVKRLTKDWKFIERDVLTDPSMEAVRNVVAEHSELKFPTHEDLKGAAVALIRLQDTYKMDTASIARGQLRGVQYSVNLTANDCFELGWQMYGIGDSHHAVLWFAESLARYEAETEKSIPRIDILDYLSYSLHMQGDNTNATKFINELIKIDPEHRAAVNLDLFKKSADRSPEESVVEERDTSIDDEYAKLCRGEGKLPVAIASRLACRYVNHGIPFLKIAPLKEEEAFLDPRIVVYHDAILDSEIKTIKEIGTSKLARSVTVFAGATESRISKTGWLQDTDHHHVNAVSQRSSDMSGGLSRETVEQLQVVNYGIGGHYLPHYDFAEEGYPFVDFDQKGNRIATVLFYLSDVDQGGATVFPKLGVSVWPKKGSAIVWWDMFLDGAVDYRTMHAACPVLCGSKWICTKWYRDRAQVFIRPCGLEKDSIPKDNESG